MCVDTLFLCFCEYDFVSRSDVLGQMRHFYRSPSSEWFTETNSLTELLVGAWLVKTALFCTKCFLFPPARCSVRAPLCLLLACRFQARTWRGTTALPPGPTSCPLVCTRSCAEERRALKFAAPPERCFDWTSDSFSPFSISAVNAGARSGCLRASAAGLFIKTGCILLRPGREMTFSHRHRKRHRGLEIPVYFLSWANSNTCLFSATPVFFFILFFFFSLCIFWPLPYREGTCQLAGRMHRLRRRWAFLHKQTRELNMYRSRKRTMASFLPTDSGGLTVHPLVALWSSSVKVYALSHVG